MSFAFYPALQVWASKPADFCRTESFAWHEFATRFTSNEIITSLIKESGSWSLVSWSWYKKNTSSGWCYSRLGRGLSLLPSLYITGEWREEGREGTVALRISMRYLPRLYMCILYIVSGFPFLLFKPFVLVSFVIEISEKPWCISTDSLVYYLPYGYHLMVYYWVHLSLLCMYLYTFLNPVILI